MTHTRRSSALAAVLAAALLAGCTAGAGSSAAAAPSGAAASAGSASAVSSSVSDSETAASAAQRLTALAGGDYGALRAFVDASIAAAPAATADRMADALIAASVQALPAATEYIYGADSDAIQQAILAARTGASGEIGKNGVICSADKAALLANMPAGEIKTALAGYLGQGLALLSAEGTYFFVVDYAEYADLYGPYTDGATAEFLTLTAAQTRQILVVEEYLCVSPRELGDRACAYEAFLTRYAGYAQAGTIRILLNQTLYKLTFPSPFDELVDSAGHVTADLLAVYTRLAAQQDCPVVQQAAKGMLDFIAAQPGGVVCQDYEMTALTDNASALRAQLDARLDALYGPLPDPYPAESAQSASAAG